MLVRSSALALCILTTFTPAALASASLRPLALPVRYASQPGTLAPGTPSYSGEAFEIRVNSRTAAALVIPARPGRLRQVGVPGLDRAAAALGAWFEPEFIGEAPPAPGNAGTDFTSFLIVHLPDGVRLEDALARFAALGEVVSVSPLALLPLSAAPNDSLFPLSPWYDQANGRDIHATEAWDVFIGDPRVVVAVLDCGVVAGHPDLSGINPLSSGNIFTNPAEANGTAGVDDDGNGYVDDVRGWDFVNLAAANLVKAGEDWRDEDNDPNDMVGHGTFCAGLIGALTNNSIGVAGTSWNVKILPVRIGYAYPGASLGNGEVRMDFVARGVRYATRMGAHVINMSFANLDTDGLGAAVTAAVDAGITVVVAAGNNGSPNDLAVRPDVLAIAAVDGNDVVAAFSNIGPQIDLAAPGVAMRSTYLQPTGAPDSLALRTPGYGSNQNGTSFSAPLVAGGVALLQGRRLNAGQPLFSPEAVKLRLVESADDIRSQNPGLDGQYGAGRLNLDRMLRIPTPSSATPIGATSVGPSAVITRKSGPARVAFATIDGRLLLLDGSTGAVIWTGPLPGPAATGVAAADLGGGHGVGLFVGTEVGSMAGFDVNGQQLTGFPTPATGIALAGGPALGDLDGDGVLEIVCGADDGDLYAWYADGTPVAGFPRTTGVGRVRAPVALSDLDGLPGVEIVVVNEAGTLRVVRGNGTLITALSKTYTATPRAPIVMRHGEGTTAVVVAEDVNLHAYYTNGTELPGYPVVLDGPVLSDPAVADLDVDGLLDVVIASAPQQLDARDSLGNHLPGWPRPLGTGIVGTPVIGQLSAASSLLELLVFRGTSLRAFENDGDSLALRPQSGGAGLFPTLADLDADGETDIVAGTGADSAFYIYSAGPGSFTFGPTSWPTPRANMARTGSTRYSARPALVDDVLPAQVVDLAVMSVTGTAATLTWTAPGDDGLSGTADHYQIKRSTSPITPGNFDDAADVLNPPFPNLGGEAETLQVTGLLEGVTYYFALRAVDAAGNRGAVSNVVNATTASIAPAQVTDLRVTDVGDTTVMLAWTATGDDGLIGRPSYYLIVASTSPLTPANFDNAAYQQIVYATVNAGAPEAKQLGGLPRGAVLSIALKAVDVSGNVSVMSNLVTATTTGGPLAGKNGVALAPAHNPGRPPVSLYWQADPAGAAGAQRVRIFDLGGRVQRNIDLGSGNGGILVWDGRNDDGERVPAGLYFIRLESGGHHANARVTLLP